MLIEIHMLKSFPPTNLNRDETGSPKTCYFGGAQRGRISSQSIKHAWRRNSIFSKMPIGIRTRYLPELIAEELKKRGVSEEYIIIARKKASKFGTKDKSNNSDKKEGKENSAVEKETNQIMFFSKADIDAIVNLFEAEIKKAGSPKKFEESVDWKNELKKCRPITLDMALFGRMITDDSFKDVEASMQVAHAISTHTVNQESDFFTAVDDLQKRYGQDEGSAMIGDIDYSSCCYYFYASLDTDQLMENIKDSEEVKAVIPDILPVLIESMAYTNPSGKQNSFAGHSYPALICIEKKKKKVPISYVNSFEKPVYSNAGYILPSIKKIVEAINKLDNCYALPIDERLWFCPEIDDLPKNSKRIDSMPYLLEQVSSWLNEV